MPSVSPPSGDAGGTSIEPSSASTTCPPGSTMVTTDIGRDLAGLLLELARRFLEAAAPDRSQPDRPQRSPVHGQGSLWSQQREGGRRTDRVHVATPQRWPPPADRQDREVQARCEVDHLGEQVGVAGEVDPVLTVEHEAEGGRHQAGRDSSSGVKRVHGLDRHATDVRPVADPELADGRETVRSHEVPGAHRDEDRDVLAEAA